MRMICPICSETFLGDADWQRAEARCPRCDSTFSPGMATVLSDTSESALPTEAETMPDRDIDEALRSEGSLQPPGYRVLGFVARGAMGVILRAHHVELDRPVAIKFPLRQHVAGQVDQDRFTREARSAARLRHPNICPIYDVAWHEGRPYIAMAFIQGKTLRDWAKSTKPAPRESAAMVSALAKAVAYAHTHGVVHRDIKPSNVMVDDETGQPVLTDFGLAKEFADQDAETTHEGQIVGTPAYMAPEQATGRRADIGPRTDVYALGAVLYDLLCGQPPFLGTVGEILHKLQQDDPLSPRRLAPSIARDLEVICLKALSKRQADRYASAEAMADDLDRFCAGQTILARRTSPPVRLWRAARRRPLTAASIVAAVLIGLGAGYIGGGAVMAQRFEAGLDVREWTGEHLEDMERQANVLPWFLMGSADERRRQVYDKYEQYVQSQIFQARIPQDEIKRIGALIAALKDRSPDDYQKLAEQLQDRVRAWNPIFALDSPFPNVGEVFDDRTVRVEDDALVPAERPAHGVNRPVMTTVTGGDYLRVEALFGENWTSARSLGLVFQTAQGDAYEFCLRVPARGPIDMAGDGPVEDFVFAIARGRQLEAVIVRSEMPLRKSTFPAADVAGGSLRLTATREGGHVTFQVNDLPPVVFDDIFPVSAGQTAPLGLLWPNGIRVTRLRGEQRLISRAPSPLEAGDVLYARQEFAEAAAFYRRQAIAAGSEDVRREARYKEGLCQWEVKREKEASDLFEQLAAEDGPRWPMLAACQLWMHALEGHRWDEAEQVYLNIAARYRFEELTALVPAGIRDDILESYRNMATGPNLVMRDPNRIRNLTRAVAAEKMLSPQGSGTAQALYKLARAYAAEKRVSEAREALSEVAAVSDLGGMWPASVAEDYSWLLRLEGKHGEALALLDRWLARHPDRYEESYSPLLLEQARVYISLGRWKDAEQSVEEFLDLLPAPLKEGEFSGPRYMSFGNACLMLGFLRERRGDSEGAMKAWRRGLLLPEGGEGPGDEGLEPFHHLMNGRGLLTAFILSSLTDTLTEDDVNRFMAEALATAERGELTNAHALAAARALLTAPLPRRGEAVRRTWQSPRGRQWAREYAWLDLPLYELLRDPFLLIGVEYVRLRAYDGSTTPEEDEMLWQCGVDLHQAYMSGKLRFKDGVCLGLTWLGRTGLLGWADVAPILDASLRGRVAYVFGRWYARCNRPEDARMFFETAVRDAPPDSLAHRQAQAELDRLPPPPPSF